MQNVRWFFAMVLLGIWVAPAGVMTSDAFWWLLTDHQWSSLVYDAGRFYFTLVWSFIMAFPCLAGAGALLDD